ncbi:MAG: C4-dicarboxylate ABC transporter, partial [Phycisphaeraceae bacterium]|nr:C4-dicarboxylate ABC transporter [Phycisphaeraceae bacterium]
MTRLTEAIRTLHPAYFAMVMATGIVAIAVNLSGFHGTALVLTGLNLLSYLVLGVLTLSRLVFFPRLLLRDMLDHNRGVGFFTLVAGTCVLGSQFGLVLPAPR